MSKQMIDVERLAIIDIQHFWLLLYETVGSMANDRPKDNDATFIWVTFNSCVKATSMSDLVDGKMLKLILSIKRPCEYDNDDGLEKYELKIYNVCEKILKIIGWPKDVGGYDGT